MVIKNRWKTALNAKGITQAELADKVGLSRPAFSAVVNGSGMLPYDALIASCNALGIEPTSVYSEKVLEAVYDKSVNRRSGTAVVSVKLRSEYAARVEALKHRLGMESYTDVVKMAIDALLMEEASANGVR